MPMTTNKMESWLEALFTVFDFSPPGLNRGFSDSRFFILSFGFDLHNRLPLEKIGTITQEEKLIQPRVSSPFGV